MLRTADLLADLELLESVYRALHPGLQRYLTATQVDAVFADAQLEFARDRTLADAFIVLTKLTAAFKCGHSYPNFFNQRADIAQALFSAPRLPFYFTWLGTSAATMVITKNFSDNTALAPGAIVVSINGRNTTDILAGLLPLARADGSNDNKRKAYLAASGDSKFEAFDILAPLVFPELRSADGMFTMQIKTLDGTLQTIRVPGQSLGQREQIVDDANPELADDAPLWQLAWMPYDKSKFAYLRMASWVAYKTKWDWQGFLSSTMKTLIRQEVPALIIDLRGNEGGSDAGDAILEYVTPRAIPRRTTVRRVKFTTVPEPLRPMLDTWDNSFYTLGTDGHAVADGWRELNDSPQNATMLTPKGRYRGRLVVLIDASNSSATFQFAAMVKKHKLGTLVGTTTGGSHRGINGGAFFFTRLPKTGLEVDLPLIGTFPPGTPRDANNVPDAGITPDVIVERTAADIAANRDPQLNAAVAIAAGKR